MQFCTLSRLSSEVGWNRKSIIDTLEAKRKARGAAYHAEKAKLAVSANIPGVEAGLTSFLQGLKAQAEKKVPAEVTQALAKLGY